MASDRMKRERPSRKAIPVKSWKAVEQAFRDTEAVMQREPNDDTVDRYCSARGQMLSTPAPDSAALNLKLQTLLELDDEREYGIPWAADLLAQTRADCDWLLSGNHARLRLPNLAFDAECSLESIERELEAVSAMTGLLANSTGLDSDAALAITGIANALDGVLGSIRREAAQFNSAQANPQPAVA